MIDLFQATEGDSFVHTSSLYAMTKRTFHAACGNDMIEWIFFPSAEIDPSARARLHGLSSSSMTPNCIFSGFSIFSVRGSHISESLSQKRPK